MPKVLESIIGQEKKKIVICLRAIYIFNVALKRELEQF